MTALLEESYRERVIREYEEERIRRGLTFGECFCGCGQKTTISPRDSIRWNDTKGHPRRFIQYHHYRHFYYPSEIDRTVYKENGVEFCLLPLSQDLFARVSPHRLDYLLQWKWYAIWAPNTGTFYAMRKQTLPDGRRIAISMQREVLGLAPGDLREGDHKNRIATLDNTDGNLQIVSATEQAQHRGKPKHNKTGYKGVFKRSDGEIYRSLIGVNNKKIHLGQRRSAEEAARLYDAAAIKYHGKFAVLNFPEEHLNDRDGVVDGAQQLSGGQSVLDERT